MLSEIISISSALILKLKNQGLETLGLEIDPKACETAIKNNLDIMNGSFQDLEKVNNMNLGQTELTAKEFQLRQILHPDLFTGKARTTKESASPDLKEKYESIIKDE